MMHTYRFAVARVRRSIYRRNAVENGILLEKIYSPYECFDKWVNSDLGVALTEQIMRNVYGDTKARDHVFRIVSDYLQDKSICRSKLFADTYREVVLAFRYGVNHINIDADDAQLLIESGIIKVRYRNSYLDIDTILNEKEAHGKLQETTDCS